MYEKYDVKYEIKRDWWVFVIIALIWIFTFSVFGRLPDKIPTHWNISGQIDEYGPKQSIFIFPAITTVIYFGMLLTPLIDPKKANYGKFAGAYRIIRSIMVIIFSALYITTTISALGYNIKVDRIVNIIISIMLIVFGNYMGKLRHNYFIGIKTPWTLADEDVWNKTHRLGGQLWVLAGIIGLFGSLFGGTWMFILLIVPLVVTSIISVVYSYIIFRNKNKNM